MDFTTETGCAEELIALFRASFTASEGAAEGAVIAEFVARMEATVDDADLVVVSARDGGDLVGAAIFSRMTYPGDARTVFILSPMAVSPDHQGKGVGQALLAYAFDHLRREGVEVVLTYGDINFYGKVGFAQVSEAVAAPPLPLSYPEGWLAQSLTGETLVPLTGASRCVEALNDPALW